MLTLTYPKRQSIAFSNTLFRLYQKAITAQDDEICFDLRRSKSLTPFAIIILTSTIFECQRKGKRCKYNEPEHENLKKFLNEIGFNNYFGLKARPIQQNIIQTTRVQLKKVSGLDALLTENMMGMIEAHLNLSAGVKGSLRMSLQETMTNVVDHSKVTEYYICAYTYPKKGQIRLCIADLGIGIRSSLRRSRKYPTLVNDYVAIKKATEEGVSCRSGRDGLGLSHIKNFIKVNEGHMCIISENGKVYWKFDQGKVLEQKMDVPFRGTIVKLIINIDKEGFYFLSDEREYLF